MIAPSSPQMKQQRAELYTKIYKYAAEDFVTTADFLLYTKGLEVLITELQAQLTAMAATLSVHVHGVVAGAPVTTPSPTPTVFAPIPVVPYVNTSLSIPNVVGNFSRFDPLSTDIVRAVTPPEALLFAAADATIGVLKVV